MKVQVLASPRLVEFGEYNPEAYRNILGDKELRDCLKAAVKRTGATTFVIDVDEGKIEVYAGILEFKRKERIAALETQRASTRNRLSDQFVQFVVEELAETDKTSPFYGTWKHGSISAAAADAYREVMSIEEVTQRVSDEFFKATGTRINPTEKLLTHALLKYRKKNKISVPMRKDVMAASRAIIQQSKPKKVKPQEPEPELEEQTPEPEQETAPTPAPKAKAKGKPKALPKAKPAIEDFE